MCLHGFSLSSLLSPKEGDEHLQEDGQWVEMKAVAAELPLSAVPLERSSGRDSLLKGR